MKLSFAAEKPDNNGFIVDFGKLRYIKEWIDDNLDHACAFSAKDPHRNKIEELAELGLIKPLFIDNASCEGLAKQNFETFDSNGPTQYRQQGLARLHRIGRRFQELSLELTPHEAFAGQRTLPFVGKHHLEKCWGRCAYRQYPPIFIRLQGCPVKCPSMCDSSAGTWHPDWVPKDVEKISPKTLAEDALTSGCEIVVNSDRGREVRSTTWKTSILNFQRKTSHPFGNLWRLSFPSWHSTG